MTDFREKPHDSPAAGPGSFPRELRVRSRSDFDLAFQRGRRVSDAALLVVCRRNGMSFSRLGISTGRRFGRAHQRNRAKRLLREAFRLDRASLPEGYDLVLVPRSPAFPDRLDDVRKILRNLAWRAAHKEQSRAGA